MGWGGRVVVVVVVVVDGTPKLTSVSLMDLSEAWSSSIESRMFWVDSMVNLGPQRDA